MSKTVKTIHGWGAMMVATTLLTTLLAGCSTTSAIPDGEQLFTGLKPIKYTNVEGGQYAITTQEEIEAALATTPAGALMGSSYYRTPLPWRLWLWNATEGKESALARWLNKTFTYEPTLLSDVNPATRAKVAETTLVNNGYFDAQVTYEEIVNGKKGKIAYTVEMNHLYTIDTLSYTNYPATMAELLNDPTANSTTLSDGTPFSTASLESERSRVSTLLRNNGYYFYKSSYASYLADTLQKPGEVMLKLKYCGDTLDTRIARQWYIGKTDIYLSKNQESGRRWDVPDSTRRGGLTIHYNGKKPPMNPRVILASMKLRPRAAFNEDNYEESLSNLIANENFSSVDFRFTPRNDCDTLDMIIACMFNKPWDITVEGKITGKTSSRYGPGAEVAIARRNLFHYGEKISLALNGAIEWQTGGSGGSGVGINSYEYGTDLTLEIPRLVWPARLSKRKDGRPRRWYTTPQTLIKVSNEVVNRGDYFNRHIMAGELTYTFQPTEQSRHILSPIIIEYDFMNSTTPQFDAILDANPYLKVSMMDQFIPKIRYTYQYTSHSRHLNPITWETTVSESANIISAIYAMSGEDWNTKEKTLLKNPYAQFVKVESDLTKKWKTGEHAELVGHLNAGVIYSYGNSSEAPYSEQFYVGGANSIRAFTVRAIGPGRYKATDSGLSYLDQTGDIKFVANLEYRPRLLGDLYGAIFLDAGNIWLLRDDNYRGSDAVFRWNSIINDMAVGTGLGLRYDLEFFVIRLDWGLGLHMPYDTGKSGFFNINRLSDCQSLHLAIGYPF